MIANRVTPRPIWAQYKVVNQLFTGLTRVRLRKYVDSGYVRMRSGETQQSACEYSVDDIDRVYACESMGKRVKRAK